MAKGEPGRQLARARLRTAILDGDVAPGQRLVEDELATAFGVTRASARVRVVSVAEAVAITECRMVLEGLCAAKAARAHLGSVIAALREAENLEVLP
jgi:DNA-binding GntR family transcriptional regulator